MASRTEALSRERIIAAAVELLDASGESGLTFRVLTERLSTGPGAIYWHVANKGELLEAATDAVIAAALATEPAEAAPREQIRVAALGLFDAIDDHPWLAALLATQLAHRPGQSVTPRILESLGRHIPALGVPEADWFTTATTLVHYVLGAAGQNSANGRAIGPDVDRDAFLDAVSSAWAQLDPDNYPFTRAVADQARRHDDRAQFLAGIDLILAGITTTYTSDLRGSA